MEDFENLGIEALQIWRLEDPNPIKLRRQDFGKFSNDQSYVIIRNESDRSSVHLWEGLKNTTNYLSKAEYIWKTMNANNLLYREYQEHESSLLMSYFSKLQYIDKVLQAKMPRLWQCSGKRIIRARQVDLNASSLTNKSWFILDCGLIQYFWLGEKVQEYVKLRSLELLDNIRTIEHGSLSWIIFVNEASLEEQDEFWQLLGGQGEVRKEKSSIEVQEFNSTVLLYKIEDSGESVEIQSPFKRKHLESDAIFFLQTDICYYVWIGKQAIGASVALQIADALIQERGLNPKLTTIRVQEGQEDVIFKQFFIWEPLKLRLDPNKLDKSEYKEVIRIVNNRIEELQDQQMEHLWLNMNEEGRMGQIQGWVIEGHDGKLLEECELGHLVDTEWYVFLHLFQNHGSDQVTIYYWIGAKAPNSKELVAANLVTELDESLENKGSHCRVVMNNESVHFLAMFKNGLTIHSGNPEICNAPTHLYKTRGSTYYNAYVIQMEAVAQSLNTGDCFILVGHSHFFIWSGKAVHENEFEQAQRLAAILCPVKEPISLREGRETTEFWELLGGKAEYSMYKQFTARQHEARLFQLINSDSALKLNELRNFSQDDLFQDDFMILDTYDEVYIWLGKRCREEEKSKAVETAVDYLEASCDGRSPDTSIIVVNSGCEPPMFIRHFLYWDYNRSAEKELQFLELVSLLSANSRLSQIDIGQIDSYQQSILQREEQLKAEEQSRVVDIKKKGILPNQPKFEQESVTLTEAQMKERDALAHASLPDVELKAATYVEKTFDHATLPSFQLKEAKNKQKLFQDNSEDPYMSRAMREMEAKRRMEIIEARNRKHYSDPSSLKVPLEEIINNCPSAVDPSRKEDYLTDEEFHKAMGMDRAAYLQVKEWKRKDLKRKAKLF